MWGEYETLEGKIKIKQPTLRAIVEIFNSVAIKVVKYKNSIER